MEPQDRPQPGTKPSTNRVRPGKGDVKVSVVNMCGPSSSILGKIYQQTALPINSTRTSRGTEPTTPTTLQGGTPHSSARARQDRSRVWLCGQRLRLRPLCIADSSPTVELCRGIQPLSAPQKRKKAPEVCAVHGSTRRW